jgi:hypothetical protein
VSEPERVDPANEEQCYFPALSAVLMPVLFPISILIAGGVWRLSGSGADTIALYLLKYIAGLLLYVIVMRATCAVRVGPQGIRGSGRTITAWQEITVVAKHSSVLVSGFHVRSALKNSIWIHQSVWKNPEFCRCVETVAASSALNRAIVTDRALTRVAAAQNRGDS